MLKQPIFLYGGSECWTMPIQDKKRSLTAETSWLRKIQTTLENKVIQWLWLVMKK